MYISPLQKAQIQLDPMFTRPGDMGDKLVSSGVIGELAGMQIIVSTKVKAHTKTAKDFFDNPIVKAGGLGIELAKSVNIEPKRDAAIKSTEWYADEHFVAYLRDSSKVVLATFLKEV